MKIYTVVTDVVIDVTDSRKSVNTRVVITLLLHDFILKALKAANIHVPNYRRNPFIYLDTPELLFNRICYNIVLDITLLVVELRLFLLYFFLSF